MHYDVFISHASEDKESFVRPLAEALRKHRVEVWYDEFSLQVGSSLRKAIDHGLSQSRFGLVVLSPSFFRKPWTEWELNGLVQRQMTSPQPVILPIWHEVNRDDVLGFSPPLADIFAIQSASGIEHVVEKLLRILFPEGSTLLTARQFLTSRGFDAPLVTDDWWLDVIEGIADQSNNRWHFPLWRLPGVDAMGRGESVGWAALQDIWQSEVESHRISQMTQPEIVLDFISKQAGLSEVCSVFPENLAEHAPQLVIPGFGGPWESQFEEFYARSVSVSERGRASGGKAGSALTIDGLAPACGELWALRHPTFGNYTPAMIACGFVQGFGAGLGPPTQAFKTFDYLVWFLSEKSSWIPGHIRNFLLLGMKEWRVWHVEEGRWTSEPSATEKRIGVFFDHLIGASKRSDFRLSKEVHDGLVCRVGESCQLLNLPESADQLTDRFLKERFIESWFAPKRRRKSSVG